MKQVAAILSICSMAAGLVAAAESVGHPITIKDVNVDGRVMVEVENDTFRLRIEPAAGGRVSGFFLKAASHELVAGYGAGAGSPDIGRLFADLFAAQTWPSELQNAAYTCEILKRGPEEVEVRLSRTATGKSSSGYLAAVDGVRVEKTYVARADSPNLRVRYALVNPTNRGKAPALWIQNIFFAGTNQQSNVYYRPSSRGLNITTYNFAAGTSLRKDDVRDPTAGWMAVLSPDNHSGLVFLLDYNYVKTIYNCQSSSTTEWFYDPVMLPGGQRWETEVMVAPVTGMDAVVYADRKVLLEAKPAAKSIEFAVRATEGNVSDVTLTATVKSTENQPLAKAPTATFGAIGVAPVRRSVALDGAINPKECVISCDLKGAGLAVKEELVFTDYDITVELLGGLGAEKLYRLPVPAKQKLYRKPNKIVRSLSVPPRCLLLEGVYHRLYQAEKALELLGWDAKASKAAKGEWSGVTLTFWPEDYSQMMGYDAVVLADVDPQALGDEGQEMLREYVKHGGGLVVLGGPFAFQAEGYPRSSFAAMLPIDYPGRMSLLSTSNSVVHAAGGPALQGLGSNTVLRCYWAHEFGVKKGGDVWLKAGEQPLLVTGTYGKGRVAVLLATPMGEGTTGEIAFWEWAGWPAYLANVMKWTAGKDRE